MKRRSINYGQRINRQPLWVACCLLGLSLLLSACYKRHTEPREAFTLHGHVSLYRTGEPVAGASIRVEASEKPSMGFFGRSYADAGSTTTDANGNFAIIPYAYSYTYAFYITASIDGIGSDEVTVYKEDVVASGASDVYADTLCLGR